MHIHPDGTAYKPESARVFLQDFPFQIAFFLHLLLILAGLDSIIRSFEFRYSFPVRKGMPSAAGHYAENMML